MRVEFFLHSLHSLSRLVCGLDMDVVPRVGDTVFIRDHGYDVRAVHWQISSNDGATKAKCPYAAVLLRE